MKKTRILAMLIASLVLVSTFAACSGGSSKQSSGNASTSSTNASASADKELVLFTWEAYVPDDIIQEFEDKTGIKVTYATFETNEDMLAKLEASDGADYDLVLASDYILDISRKSNLLSKLDTSKIANFGNIGTNFQSKFFDEKNEYVVPYIAGTPLIVYDPAKVSVDIKGYDDLWNPALKDSVVVMDDARNLIGITLKTLGKSFNETDTAVLEQAREKLLKLKPNIRALDYNTPYTLMLSGEATVGYMFTSQVNTVLAEKPDFKVVYPKEGMGFGIDGFVVPVNAPHKDAAHQFLNFVLDPEIGSRLAQATGYICTNKASYDLLPKEFKDNPAVYIPDDLLGKTEFIQDVGDAASKFDEIWTEFKQN